MADTKTQDAVIRNFEVIGEAVKSLSQAHRDAHPGIPWKRIDDVARYRFGMPDLAWREFNDSASTSSPLAGVCILTT